MNASFKIYIACIALFFGSKSNAQKAFFSYGIVDKLEMNRSKIFNDDNSSYIKRQTPICNAFGLYAAKSLGNRVSIDASFLKSRAVYDVNYKAENAIFKSSDIRFFEGNINVNFVINPEAINNYVFVFGGVQYLQRNWGTENFINATIPNSFWPASRTMLQTGLGMKFYLGKHCVRDNDNVIQPFIGIRYAKDQYVVYDTPLNQFYFGVIIAHEIKSPEGRRGCANEF